MATRCAPDSALGRATATVLRSFLDSHRLVPSARRRLEHIIVSISGTQGGRRRTRKVTSADTAPLARGRCTGAPRSGGLERPCPRLELHRLGAVLLERACVTRSTGLRRHQHEPLDDEEALRERLHTSSPTARTSSGRCSSPCHNMPVESYPWRFSSVISVGSHEESDPLDFFYNPSPPVEFFGRGVNVEVPGSAAGSSLSRATASRRRT